MLLGIFLTDTKVSVKNVDNF